MHRTVPSKGLIAYGLRKSVLIMLTGLYKCLPDRFFDLTAVRRFTFTGIFTIRKDDEGSLLRIILACLTLFIIRPGTKVCVRMDNYRQITADQLRERIKRDEPGLIVDLRDSAEFDQEHIAGSINLPLTDFSLEKFLRDYPDSPVYLLCASGQNACRTASLFYQSGFFDVFVLAGGILSWRVLGFPLVGKIHDCQENKNN